MVRRSIPCGRQGAQEELMPQNGTVECSYVKKKTKRLGRAAAQFTKSPQLGTPQSDADGELRVQLELGGFPGLLLSSSGKCETDTVPMTSLESFAQPLFKPHYLAFDICASLRSSRHV